MQESVLKSTFAGVEGARVNLWELGFAQPKNMMKPGLLPLTTKI